MGFFNGKHGDKPEDSKSKRSGFNDPQKIVQVRDAKGNLLGYKADKPNFLGVTQVWGKKGNTLGWSKDAESGGLGGTFKFGSGKRTSPAKRITHGENPDMLFADQDDD